MMEKRIAAFSLQPVLDAPGLTCLAPWDGVLLAGTDRGGLLVAKSTEDGAWAFSRHLRNFGTGPVRQLEPTARSMLLSLDGDGVNAYSLPSFSLKAQAARTGKARCFAWDDGNGMLVAATKKRLAFFHYDGLEFVPLKEVHLPQPASELAIVWPTVYVGMAKEYTTVDATTWAVGTPFAAGNGSAACLARVSPSEVLLLREGQGVFLGAEGRLSRRRAEVPFTHPPLRLSLSEPYVVALCELGFEARPLEPLSSSPLVQTLACERVLYVTSSSTAKGVVFLLQDGEGGDDQPQLLSLAPLPFAEQASSLLRDCEYEEALAVAGLAPAEDPEVGRLKDAIHAEYARALFRRGDYNDALLHFSMGKDSGPLQLLLLLPSLSPKELRDRVLRATGEVPGTDSDGEEDEEPVGDDFQRAVAIILPYLLSARSRLASAAAGRVGDAGGAFDPSGGDPLAVLLDMAVLKALLILPDSGALIQFIQRPNCIDLELGGEELHEAGRYSELVCLYQSRGRHTEALCLLEALSQRPESLTMPPQGAAAELRGLPGVWAAVKYVTGLGPEDAELVTEHARWILDADPDSGLEMFTAPGSALTPKVVLPILEEHAPMLEAPYLESALASGRARADVYEQKLALIYLRQVERGGSGTAAETKLRELVQSSSYVDYEDLLARLPRDQLHTLRIALFERLGRHLDALHVFVHVLDRFDEAEAYCDRVYARQREEARFQQQRGEGEHRIAQLPEHAVKELRLDWVHGGRDRLSLDQSFNIYLLFIQALLDEKDNSGAGYHIVSRGPDDGRWAEIAQLLSRKRNVIHPLQALELLPGEVSLHRALPFLEGAVLGMQERTRAAALQRSLISAEHAKLRGEEQALEMRCVRITPERACSICYKRIGTAAFVAFPSGMLAHYSCFRRMAASDAQAW